MAFQDYEDQAKPTYADEKSTLATPPPTPGILLRGTAPKLTSRPTPSAPSGYFVTKPGPRAIATSLPWKLHQLQYRSYRYTIPIYHYSEYLLPVQSFKNSLTCTSTGWHHSLTSTDPLHNSPVPDGDELPPGRIEVAYLPNVFQGKGSAIGFRDHERNQIEWLCFYKSAMGLLSAEYARGPNGEPLFDNIAMLEKGGKGEKGHPEHRAWFESIMYANKKTVKMNLTWKNRDDAIMEARKTGEETSNARGDKAEKAGKSRKGSGLRVRFGVGNDAASRKEMNAPPTPEPSPRLEKKVDCAGALLTLLEVDVRVAD